MGAWGCGNFENDDALDWVSLLEKSKDKTVIHQGLDAVLANGGYLESPDCCNALAAAEVVLAGVTGDYSRISDEASKWLKRKHGFIKKSSITFDGEDVSKSVSAIDKILKSSELKDLWEETEDYLTWFDIQTELLTKLKNKN